MHNALRRVVAGIAACLCLQAASEGQPVKFFDQKVVASDASTADGFATSVSVDGDSAAIGVQYDGDLGPISGSVWIYERAAGVWTPKTKLLASDGAQSDQLGMSVSISGSTVVAGASVKVGVGMETGAAYVFERTGGVWGEVQKLQPSDPGAFENFGNAVAVSGDVIVVGSFHKDVNGPDSGAAYVFERTNGAWPSTEIARLVPSDGAAGNRFGWSVAVSGDTVLVGSFEHDGNGTEAGAVYVFEKNGGAWPTTETGMLLASDGAAQDWFGSAVAASGDLAVIGAQGDQDVGPFTGSSYIFERVGGTWMEVAKLVAPVQKAHHVFGGSVGIFQDSVVIGAWGDADLGAFAGAAYVYRRAGSAWPLSVKILALDGEPDDNVGVSSSISGDVVLVGAPFDSDAGDWAGSAYFSAYQEICQPDVAPGGPGSVTIEICGFPLSSGHSADFSLVGAAPNAAALGIVGASQSPTYFPPAGTFLCPSLDTVVPLVADGAGEIHLPSAVPGGGGLQTLYVQCVVDASGFGGTSAHVSNCVEVTRYP